MLHGNAGVEREHALRIRDQRVDVDLAYLAMRGGEPADADQHRGNGVDVGRGMAAIALQQAPDAGALHLGARQRQVERRQLQRGVAEQFDGGAAVTEQHHRPEQTVHAEPDDKFDRTRTLHHLLHQEAGKPRLGPRLADPFEHVVRRGTHPVGTGQVQRHAAQVGLVGDVRRADLDRHRTADLGGGACRGLGIADATGTRRRNAVGIEHHGDLVGVEPAASGRQGTGDRRACRLRDRARSASAAGTCSSSSWFRRWRTRCMKPCTASAGVS